MNTNCGRMAYWSFSVYRRDNWPSFRIGHQISTHPYHSRCTAHFKYWWGIQFIARILIYYFGMWWLYEHRAVATTIILFTNIPSLARWLSLVGQSVCYNEGASSVTPHLYNWRPPTVSPVSTPLLNCDRTLQQCARRSFPVGRNSWTDYHSSWHSVIAVWDSHWHKHTTIGMRVPPVGTKQCIRLQWETASLPRGKMTPLKVSFPCRL